MPVTLLRALELLHARRVAVSPETAGFVVLSMAEGLAGAPGPVDPSSTFLGEDGSITTPAAPAGGGAAVAAAGLRGVLAELLGAVSGAPPALVAVASAQTGELAGLLTSLQRALVPLNRTAARRAVGRLARDVLRAGEGRAAPTGLTPAVTAAAAVPAPSPGALSTVRAAQSPAPPPAIEVPRGEVAAPALAVVARGEALPAEPEPTPALETAPAVPAALAPRRSVPPAGPSVRAPSPDATPFLGSLIRTAPRDLPPAPLPAVVAAPNSAAAPAVAAPSSAPAAVAAPSSAAAPAVAVTSSAAAPAVAVTGERPAGGGGAALPYTPRKSDVTALLDRFEVAGPRTLADLADELRRFTERGGTPAPPDVAGARR